MRTSTGLRLLLCTLAATTSLSAAWAQTAPTGRPPRIQPAATPTPTPTSTPGARPAPISRTAPAATPTPAPAPIRIGTPKPAATPAPAPAAPKAAPAPAPIRLGTPKPAATPAPTPAAPAAPPAAAKPAPVVAGQPKPVPKAPTPGSVPPTIPIKSIASRESDPPRGGAGEIVPSSRQAAPKVPDQIAMPTGIYSPKRAVITQGGFTDRLKQLGPTNTFTLADLKSGPPIQLGTTKVDMSRVLANPKSVANRAVALEKLGDSVRINTNSFAVTRVKDGLVVRSFVNYSLLPGTCTVLARRKKVEAAGVRCATPMTAAERDKAFSTPGDPRYVADPAKRAAAIAEAKKRGAEDAQMLATDVSRLRADLQLPELRAELVAALGEAEVKRLEGLDDAGLAAEIVNSGDTKMEDVSYIPLNDVAETFKPAVKLGLVPPPLPPEIQESFDLGTQYFLAGFTFGREYEWRLRIEQRINRCLIGCAKTYFVEAFAGFNYGLGLRFPIEVTGSAVYNKSDTGTVTASVTPTFRTFDGQPEHYLKAGLAPEKLFDGQEFVAQFGAHAGFGYDLPLTPSVSIAYAKQLDFTDYLDGKFKGGNFAPPNPPAPGQPGERLEEDLVLDDIDLIGGQANFGFVGAQVFPAANFILTSNELSFDLVDRNAGKTVPNIASGQMIQLKTDSATGALEFDIKDPVYKLTLTVEPGINARVFVDIGLWGKTWDMPVYFPSLAITVPSGGVTFACHDGTVCARDYKLSPDAKKLALQGVARWANEFETIWLKQCRDSECEKGVRDIREAYQAVMTNKIEKSGVQSPDKLNQDPYFANLFSEAGTLAEKAWAESALRRFNIEFEPTWIGKCADDACRNAIKSLRASTDAELKAAIAKGTPAPVPNQVYLGIISQLPATVAVAQDKARTTVLASLNAKIAAAKDKWIGKVKGEYDPQCHDDQCRLEVALIADQMGGEAAKLGKLSPELTVANVVTEVTKDFRPRFKKAVADGLKRKNAAFIK